MKNKMIVCFIFYLFIIITILFIFFLFIYFLFFFAFCPPVWRDTVLGFPYISLFVMRDLWSVVLGSWLIVSTLWAQLFLQFLTNPFETS